MASSTDTRASLAIARIIPALIIGLFVYVCYAVTKQLCINYLIHPSPHYHHSPRLGAGVVIIVIFYILLIAVLTTYIRVLSTIIWNTGFLPRGAACNLQQKQAENTAAGQRDHQKHRSNGQQPNPPPEKVGQAEPDLESGLDYKAAGKAYPFDAYGLESFYTKDVFVCQEDGRPRYCSKCCQFKTDRAHHCREVDRCVRKMDHFCPWVGGVVSETSYKFFIQFVFYTSLFCIFNIIITAVFTAELRQNAGRVNAQWLVVLGVSCFFGLFASGMTLSSLQLAMNNLTTIENIGHKTKVWTLAVHIPRPHDIGIDPETQWAATFPTVTYPAPRSSPLLRGQDSKSEDRRVFAILRTQPGENPWDLGSYMKNLQQVMGYTVADWLLPLKQSPCADHSSLESAFALGPAIQKLKREAGLEPPEQPNGAAVNGRSTPAPERYKNKRADRPSRSVPSEDQSSDGIGPALPPQAYRAHHHSLHGHHGRESQASSSRSQPSEISSPSGSD
ncbi:hypothetical protein DTO164E3_6231 [Paecilomyces variotii]|nr:hypothetical protein DTO032I3_6585 [Paecilomyces variotii]KAJ9196431.1 hypothetical protein DTO164E3_6231 [Paecilomyces variotii]KAJ9261407.1 hypothetical protein DTO195F2_4203 [Paecilomyces variotii]KAJ9279598.1 hypothetical protein DTO021D3_3389 [Paecilomyces variotii]KAJ9347406.1 hypothetical protein DTO027B6_280 [Paecilomyces variotii]